MRRKLRNTILNQIFTALLLVFLPAVLLCGCGGIKKEKKPKKQAGLTDITVVLDWTPNTNHTGLYVAQEKGYFREEGLDVTIVLPPEDGATNMVAYGDADFGIAFQNQLAEDLSVNANLPVTAVAAVYQHNQDGLVSLRSKDIDTPVKLMDQSYATAEELVEHAIIRTVVEMDGGDFSRVELVPSYVDNAVEALNSGGLSAVWGSYGWEGISCLQQKYSINFIPFSSQSEVFDYYNVLLIGNNNFLEKQPELAKAFMRAVSRGYEFAAINPEKAGQILIQENPNLDAKLVQASQEYVSGQYFAESTRFGFIDAARWSRFFAWINEKQILENQIPEDAGFTNDFLAEPSTSLPLPSTSFDPVYPYEDGELDGLDMTDSSPAPANPSYSEEGKGGNGGDNSALWEDESSTMENDGNTGNSQSDFGENQGSDDVDDDTRKPNGYN